MQKTKRINTSKKHQNTRSRTHTLLQHKSHSDSIWAPKCLPNAPQKRSKNDQKNKTKNEQQKERKKRPKRAKKSREAPTAQNLPSCERKAAHSNAICLLCFLLLACCFALLFFKYFFKKRNISHKLLKIIKKSLFLLLLRGSWPLLGRF